MIDWFKELVLKDVWLKLFSLALAVLVWFTVNSMASQKEVLPVRPHPLIALDRRTFDKLPVLIVSSAEDTRTVHVNPKTVQVVVEGEARLLNSLRDRDIRVTVDLTGIEAAHDLRQRVEVSTPAGVAQIQIQPEEVQVVFPAPKSTTP